MSTSEPTDALEPDGTPPRYEEYEDSGVDWLGEIPAQWDVTRLKFLADFTGGGTPSKDNLEYWDGEVPWVSPKDMKAGRVTETQNQITPKAVDESSTRLVEPGSVLIVVRSGILKHTIPVATNEVEVALNQDLKAVTPKEGLHSRYLTYLIEGRNDTLLLKWTKSGTTVESLEQERISNTQIPFPSFDEQCAIAAYLDRETERIDALIEKKKQLIDLLEEKRTALISRVVTQGLNRDVEMQDTGVEWLGEIPAGWNVMKLKYAIQSIEQGWSPQCESRKAGEDEWAVLKAGCVNGHQFDPTEHKALPRNIDPKSEYQVEPDDILMSRANTRKLLGSAVAIEEHYPKLLLCDKLYRLRTRSSIDSNFLVAQLSSHVARYQMERDATGASASMQNISQDTVQNLIFLKPPLSEQRRISSHLKEMTDRIDTLLETMQEGIERLKEYRTALISAAVTGQIDVREEEKTRDVKGADTWDRMILTLELIRRMRAAQHQSLGRTLLVKMLYLIQHHVWVTGMGFNYKRKDYGPYASELRYKVENALQNQGWIRVSEDGERVHYELLEQADDDTVQAYFESSWGDVEDQIDEIVSYFQQFDAERAEIVATLYAAWNDLKILGRPHDEEAIIREVRENWHPRKQEIDESRWRKALHWMKDEGLVPTGFGEATIEEGN
jgi:type I restriction enzyme S subunit